MRLGGEEGWVRRRGWVRWAGSVGGGAARGRGAAECRVWGASQHGAGPPRSCIIHVDLSDTLLFFYFMAQEYSGESGGDERASHSLR